MFKRLTAIVFAAALAFGAAAPASAQQYLQCAPYARLISGIQLFGDAAGWWGQAAGKYERGQTPEVGAALVFKAGGGMRVGHVATVSSVVDSRTIRLTHANWSRRGGVERDVLAVDASPNNDWSEVKVWYAPVGGVGTSAHAAYGFVYPDAAARGIARIDSDAHVQLASLDTDSGDDDVMAGGGVSN